MWVAVPKTRLVLLMIAVYYTVYKAHKEIFESRGFLRHFPSKEIQIQSAPGGLVDLVEIFVGAWKRVGCRPKDHICDLQRPYWCF